MKRITVFLAAVFLAMAAAGCGNSRAEIAGSERAMDFELRDMKGNSFRLSDYSGKVIVLNFFATWCRPCSMEMPDFDTIQKEYPDRVKIIAVNVGRENAQRIKEFASAKNLDFTIAMDNGAVSRLYGPMPGIPVTVIINRDFNIAGRYIGLRPKEVFVRDIKELLK